MIDLAQEIADNDRKLADVAHAEQSGAELRARRAELLRAQQLEQEAQQRAREARDAAAKLKAAEDADREAQAAPRVAALDAVDAEFGDLERETTAKLWEAVRASRSYHDRHAAIVAKHTATLAELRAVDPEAASRIVVRHPQSLRAFVTTRWQRFNGDGMASDDSCHWSRTLAAEEG